MQNGAKMTELFERQQEYVKERTAVGIETYRKGDAEIYVADANGAPIPGAKIKAVQKTHEFRFGANLFMLDEMETPRKNELYKRYFADVFNMATLPFYWDATEPEEGNTRYDKYSKKMYRRPAIDLCMEFCEQNGIEPREHALAYEQFFPKWLYTASVEKIKKAFEKRCEEIATRYADRIRTIEVTNEMEWLRCKTAFYGEPDYVEWCFKTAEKYFPKNILGINEHTALSWMDSCMPTDKYYAYIEANLLKGARIDAIGMQYHLFNPEEKAYEFTRRTLDPHNLFKHMDLYANFKKPLQITEITVPAYSRNAEDEAIQAEIIGQLYTIWFSHPNVSQIIYWNLVDGYAYVSDPAYIATSQGNMSLGENIYYGGLLRFDMTPKPAYEKIKDLTQRVWHTDAAITADDCGCAFFRGFYGSYELEIVANGKTVKTSFSLSSGKRNRVNVTV